MRQHVKVKCVSLADEAKLICKYERERLAKAAYARSQGKEERADYHYQNYWSMRQHRVNDIRKEARIANVAYGFLLGRPYNKIERNSYTQPNWGRIKSLVLLKGEGDKAELEKRYDAWEVEALAGQPRYERGGYPNDRNIPVPVEFIQPRSISKLPLYPWATRFFQGNVAAWMQWMRGIHPLRVKVPYNPVANKS